jgi:hypothetical protein
LVENPSKISRGQFEAKLFLTQNRNCRYVRSRQKDKNIHVSVSFTWIFTGSVIDEAESITYATNIFFSTKRRDIAFLFIAKKESLLQDHASREGG